MLVGRTVECARIQQLLADSRVGTSGALLLYGDAGIGKSALLRYAVECANGMRVLAARGVESEADIPFASLHELLRPALPSLERLPELQAEALRGALALGPAVPSDRFLIGAATLSLLTAYSEQGPLLVALDDAHWLDRSSADALVFAIRRLVADPIAVVLTESTGAATPFRAAGLPELAVTGLDREAAGVLLDREVGPVPSASIDMLYRASAGNPLALLEFAREAPSLQVDLFDRPLPVSARLEEAFKRQMTQLTESARRALLVAAVCDSGDPATVLAAARALDVESSDVEQAEAVGLLRIRDGTVQFRHPLIRSVAFQIATTAQQRAAHAAVAKVLTGPRDADRRAWHLASAVVGSSDEVAAALEVAARAALDRSAYAGAATAFERAAQLSTGDEAHAQRLFAAAEAAWSAGGAERSIYLLEQAGECTKDTALWAEIEHLRGRAMSRCGSVMAGHDILVEAATRLQAVDPVGATAMLAEAAIPLCELGAAEQMLETAQKAWDIAADVHDERATFFASLATGTALIFAGHRDQEGAGLLRRAASIVERAESLRSNPHVAIWAGISPLWLRDNSRGREALLRTVDVAREHGALGELPFALSQLAVDSASSDRWPAAYAEFSELIHLTQETGQPIIKCQGVAGLCRLEARQGRVDDCRAHAAEALELADRLGLGLFRIWVTLGLTDLALGLAEYHEAIRHGEAVGTWLGELRIGDPDLSPAPELVFAYTRLGRIADADVVSREFIQRAEEKGQPWSLARAARCRGLLANEASFEPHFLDALSYHAQTLDSFERARTCLQFGERLRRARRRSQAREQLREAYEMFERLGATLWADQAQVELLATGETARRRDASSVDQLTPQEFQVAQLLARGATTREAAAKLFLSPKTIEYHLRSVYRKLDIRTRSSLTTLFVDEANSGRRSE